MLQAAPPLAQGRLKGAKPVGVLDIGSNSVRLVVYEHHARALTPLFNEKSACTLGRGVAQSGMIAPQNLRMALLAIRRFALVVKLLEVETLHIIATSAVREAANGPAFMARVEEITGFGGQVLSGEQEARFGAYGVVSGMPDFSGIVGDLGGGSLELFEVGAGLDAKGISLELGVIRLEDESAMSAKIALNIAARRLQDIDILGEANDKKNGDGERMFCAIGGTWRALAKLLQFRSDYPLHMVQNYQVSVSEVLVLAHELVEKGDQTPGLEKISRVRAALLPYGAAVLIRIIEAGGFTSVVFSALGVREGYLFAQLGGKQSQVHPLLQGAREMCLLRARSPEHGQELIGFTASFLETMAIRESVFERRWREAACFLSDIGWRNHPDYRGEQSVDLVAYGALSGISHGGRAFLAEALSVRYVGLKRKQRLHGLGELMSDEQLFRARMIGAVLRVAYALSGAIPHVLPRIRFQNINGKAELVLPADFSFLNGSRLESHLAQLARHMGFDA
ncbi:Exopolyphosphatase [hydrothermal vent metagenome]|uniref:Exopolyphosphatase n=1 Tax=hydrothermal vent metagenome TaxID=652676 RepID=A0A3B0TLF3_9ZZZZ